MTKRMLIDTTHAEETRVVVLDGNRLDDYDVETATKKQIKGNIYLAKIVRIEPSLQAAFVEYGGNRHGFLAFSEIHPDYYQIPVADRERLLALQEEEARAEEARADREELGREEFGREHANGADQADAVEAGDPASDVSEVELPAGANDVDAGETGPAHRVEAGADAAGAAREGEPTADAPPHRDGDGPDSIALEIEADEVVAADDAVADEHGTGGTTADAGFEPEPADDEDEAPAPEQVSGESSHDDGQAQRRTARFLRQYKIQEVMRRRQILLVQVVKEERGNKGAALTTYVSLAGRFSVLMPNSPRGGGVSRKITSAADRRRLKEVTAELDLPRGMGMIIRTAGAQRPRQEILRDGEYLLRTWDDIRETTLASTAPCLVYEEASLIKRAIRDLYTRDIEEIVVDGETGWKGAREFMRQLMPGSHGRVNLWRNAGSSLFNHHNVEQHLDSMLQPSVQLRSGGYLVINQTEALVAIDVNSGRATRERSIEDTALRTNLEAADEVARQLRLRDLAGLIVIDFIDMESRRNNAAVERRLKDALRNDRARIQVGSISAFGLMEMSRQRLRPSLAESSFVPCPHCNGSGYMRGTESSSLHVLRAIEEEAAKRRSGEILVHVATPVALYVLNHKRLWLREIETRHHLVVNLAVDDTLVPPGLRIEKLRPYAPPAELAAPVEEPERTRAPAEARRIPISDGPREPDASEDETETAAADAEQGAEGDGGRKRRRRRRRGGRRENGAEQGVSGEAPAAADEEDDRPGEEADDATPSLAPGESLDSPSVFADGDGEGAAPVVAEAGTGESGDRRGRRRRGGRNRNRFGGDRDLPARDGEARDRDDHVRDGSRDGERAPQRAYSGPTPADPFAGSYDIFAMMETDGEESGVLLPDPSASAASLGAAEPGADGSRDVPEREAEILPPVATTSEPSTPAVAEPLGTAAEDPDAMPEAKLPPTSLAQTPAVQTGEPDMIAPDTLGAEPVAADAATADAVPAKPARVTRARKPKDAKEPKEPKPAKEPRAPRARRSKAAAVTDAAGPATDGVAPDATDTAVAETAAPAPVAAEAPAEPAAVPPTEPDAGTAGSRDPSIVQPTVIGDAPAPARRTGWWKR